MLQVCGSASRFIIGIGCYMADTTCIALSEKTPTNKDLFRSNHMVSNGILFVYQEIG